MLHGAIHCGAYGIPGIGQCFELGMYTYLSVITNHKKSELILKSWQP
jgi:hypothetical protein